MEWEVYLGSPDDRSRQPHQYSGHVDGVGVEVEILRHVEHVQQGRRYQGLLGSEHHHYRRWEPAVEGEENIHDPITARNIVTSPRSYPFPYAINPSTLKFELSEAYL